MCSHLLVRLPKQGRNTLALPVCRLQALLVRLLEPQVGSEMFVHFAARELVDLQAFAPGELIVPPTEATVLTSVAFQLPGPGKM